MKIIGIIPARSGSKGVKNKNIAVLGKKPLISYTINSALKSNLDKVIVSTNCDKISSLAKSFGAEVPFKRPQKLATDNAKSIDVIIHALKEIERKNNETYDYIMMLQPTTPFRNSEDINKSIELISQSNDADSVISVVNVGGYHPARMKYITKGILIDPVFCEKVENQNRQELREMYIRNGAIYLTKRETLLSKSFKGKKCLAYEMGPKSSINIDTIADFNYAKYIIENFEDEKK